MFCQRCYHNLVFPCFMFVKLVFPCVLWGWDHWPLQVPSFMGPNGARTGGYGRSHVRMAQQIHPKDSQFITSKKWPATTTHNPPAAQNPFKPQRPEDFADNQARFAYFCKASLKAIQAQAAQQSAGGNPLSTCVALVCVYNAMVANTAVEKSKENLCLRLFLFFSPRSQVGENRFPEAT